ncbi:RWD domain-containing protein 1 [Seminavis robusta]|uniref:RWD domain-containing protein 1 n=1 Tax=Seminavis robusta TaxID=568900 RepID=A0A9N8DKW3_9STRA|nr:RWD domain-containing protein 1 [Seminavis robusta]|eukprot:Sro113_g055980.1 RWD domain-containing protein 1 (301) ;mRNA; f:33718-35048
MTDHQEEQEMEAEALAAIFDDQFSIVQGDSSKPLVWNVTLWPEATTTDGENHVGIELQVTLPETYPEDALPSCDIHILKGLTQDHATQLLDLCQEEAQANEGVPSIFAICERLREWLVDHNQKGHDDVSMHAQMLRRNAEQEKKQQEQSKQQQFESQKAHADMTQTERDDLELRRKRAEGTPVTNETFEAWKIQFEQEMAALKEQQDKDDEAAAGNKKKSTPKVNEKKGRLSGFQQFSGAAINLEALEAAAENAQTDPEEEEEEEEGALQEELFDVDDEDLDDLDFDDDDDDDDEEDVDI